MKMQSLALALMVAAVVLTSSLAFSQGNAERIEPLNPQQVDQTGGFVNETPQAWFIELSGKPIADGGNPGLLKKQKDAFRAAAAKAGIPFTERFAFDTLWNGVSVNADMAAAAKLANLDGVAAIYPVVKIERPEPAQLADSVPELFTALAMTGADIAQSSLGFTGEGVKVAVMDTGIDYDHPDLGGCFGPGCRVAYGYDLVGDDFNADPGSPSYNPVPVPDDDPDDCQGHGTHVAGIVGANGVVTGVAPNVTFGAYRVFGCEGSTTSDIMIAAMEMALADGMDVLNMSIGSAYQWPQYPTAAASDRMVNQGMVVVASIGNYASTGAYSAGAPGVGDKVIGVASFDNSHAFGPYFEVDGVKISYNQMSFADPAPTSGTEEIVFVGRGCDGDPYLADPAGKVALIERGACTFNMKATNALAAGATAAVVHNNAPGNFNGTLGSYVPIVAVSISQADGLFIRGLEPVDMTWTDEQASFPSATGGLISSFSSYGLAPDLSLKPDIGAPGGGIYSTYPLELGGYATLGGTSMASPHVAGAVALLLEAHPSTPAQAVRRILQNSADPAVWWGNPGLGFLDNVHRQGAGMLDIDDAILATTRVEPGKIATGEGEFGPTVHTLMIENKGYEDVVYDLSFVNALSTLGTFSVSFFLSNASVSFSAPSVAVPADGMASVDVTITPATGPSLGTYGGYIVLTPQGGGQVYRVPFAGFIGDYQGKTVLFDNCCDLPWLIGGPTFTMEDGDIPDFWVIFAHQSRAFRMEVFDAHSGKSLHRVYDLDYLPRNSSGTSFYSFPWDGTTFNGKKTNVVPDGDYVVVISVLKALGDGDNPDHWETWTSPVITIDRP